MTLGRQFDQVVQTFPGTMRQGDSHQRRIIDSCYGDPAGMCGNAASAFEKHAKASGVEAKYEEANRYDVGPHSYNVMGDRAVDWTHRQFDPEAAVPHVEPLAEYHKRLSAYPEPRDD